MTGNCRVVMRYITVVVISLAAGCASGGTSDFNIDGWSTQIFSCLRTLESQNPNADKARMWIVCEDEFWSDKQDLLRDLCSDDPEFASCMYQT